MKKIRWGILGAGNIAATFAMALQSMDDSTLAAVASRNPQNAMNFAEKFNIEQSYSSYGELVRDADVDVIYIAVPHTEHKNMAKLCIQNKKAVLCEKPFTINSRDAEELIDTAYEYKVFLMEAMWTKFLPASLKVKEWVDKGRIGKILHIKASFGFASIFDKDNRLYNPNLGGGALLDVGIYPISYTTFLLNKTPDRIISSAVIGDSQVDEQNIMIFQYEDGIMADLSSSISAGFGDGAIIVGDKGVIRVDKFWMADSAKLYDNKYNCLDTFKEPFMVNGYEYEAAEVNRCLREGLLESPLNPLQDTLINMKLMDQIRTQWGLIYPEEINK